MGGKKCAIFMIGNDKGCNKDQLGSYQISLYSTLYHSPSKKWHIFFFSFHEVESTTGLTHGMLVKGKGTKLYFYIVSCDN